MVMAISVHELDYGPLQGLIGVWVGDKGSDISPEPDGTEENSYHERITFEPAGEISNAEEQNLCAVQYRQQVWRKRDEKLIHDQSGYWSWSEQEQQLIHSFSIPRGMSVVAGGKIQRHSSGAIELSVAAKLNATTWSIIQSPFMSRKASCSEFSQTVELNGDRLKYQQTMELDIYGRTFSHTDESTLARA